MITQITNCPRKRGNSNVEPLRLVTDKLRSYGGVHRTTMPSVTHDTRQYANNRTLRDRSFGVWRQVTCAC